SPPLLFDTPHTENLMRQHSSLTTPTRNTSTPRSQSPFIMFTIPPTPSRPPLQKPDPRYSFPMLPKSRKSLPTISTTDLDDPFDDLENEFPP
ncbi:hypothetical protein HK097_006890, partial [Rhizophlyctis rosea]